jgi:hypothetical protein
MNNERLISRFYILFNQQQQEQKKKKISYSVLVTKFSMFDRKKLLQSIDHLETNLLTLSFVHVRLKNKVQTKLDASII